MIMMSSRTASTPRTPPRRRTSPRRVSGPEEAETEESRPCGRCVAMSSASASASKSPRAGGGSCPFPLPHARSDSSSSSCASTISSLSSLSSQFSSAASAAVAGAAAAAARPPAATDEALGGIIGSSSSSTTRRVSASTVDVDDGCAAWRWKVDESRLGSQPLHSQQCQRWRKPLAALDAPLSAVLDRLEAFMKVNSIACDFCPHSGEGDGGGVGYGDDVGGNAAFGGTVSCCHVDCRTKCRTHFVVYLWREDENAGSRRSSQHRRILVQLERRRGCSVKVQAIRRGLHRALHSGAPAATAAAPTSNNARHPERGGSPISAAAAASAAKRRPICPGIRKLYEDRVTRREIREVSRRRSCLEELANCARLLDSGCGGSSSADASQLLFHQRHQRHELGMENLAYLTDRAAVGSESALHAATALLFPSRGEGAEEGAEAGPAPALRETFRAYFRVASDLPSRTADYTGESSGVDFRDARHFEKMHSLALQALANALEVLVRSGGGGGGKNSDHNRWEAATSGEANRSPGGCRGGAGGEAELPDTMSSPPSREFWVDVVDALALNLTAPIVRPQEAAMSARCLSLLEDLTPGTPARLLLDKQDALVPHLIAAHRFGEVHHLSLEQESEHLMEQLCGIASVGEN